MDRELEEQIDSIIQKATKDLKTRIVRIAIRHQNKLLKNQAREFKTPSAPRRSTQPPVRQITQKTSRKSKDSKYHSDSDTDGYYSE